MWTSSTCRIGLQSLLLAALFVADGAHGGSCREASLCCNGRDSACVVQKVPHGAITTDLNVKPCYCDHACLKLRDCCPDFKAYCGGCGNRGALGGSSIDVLAAGLVFVCYRLNNLFPPKRIFPEWTKM